MSFQTEMYKVLFAFTLYDNNNWLTVKKNINTSSFNGGYLIIWSASFVLGLNLFLQLSMIYMFKLVIMYFNGR